ncbi:MAG: BON domain-containing protein [Caldilineaceae bacterium]
MPRDVAARYFYERAEALVVERGSQAALTEVRRGLAYAPTAELLLLGAILSEQQGAYDLMRGFVAEIPLEDSLREEAEWLLRSHQMRQRALRLGQPTQAPHTAEAVDINAVMPVRSYAEARAATPLQPAPSRSRQRVAGQRVWPTAMALILLIAVLWTGWRALNPILDSTVVPPLNQSAASGQNETTAATEGSSAVSAPARVPAQEPVSTAGQAEPPLISGEPQVEIDASNLVTATDAASVEAVDDPAAADADTARQEEPTGDGQGEDAVGAGDAAEDAVPAVEPPPTSTPEPIVDSTPAGALLDQDLKPFDILAYLKEAGRPDLAQLSVDAQIRDGELIIYGVVPWAEHRRDILAVTQNVAGVERVNSVDLRVRVPATYTVQEGDTLWIIAYRLYDDPARWPEIVSYNQALIPNPQSLRLGSTIQAPPAR